MASDEFIDKFRSLCLETENASQQSWRGMILVTCN